jgi:hypothetical protein
VGASYAVNPLVVNELRMMFKSGATPSALIRRIVERHVGEARLDHLVRAYFREAFHIPMIQIGLEQVKQIAEGGSLPILNTAVLLRMVQARSEWDQPEPVDDPSRRNWLDSAMATGNSTKVVATDPKAIPELAGSWDLIDDLGREFIQRLIGAANSMHEQVSILAGLAERLQEQVQAPAIYAAKSA